MKNIFKATLLIISILTLGSMQVFATNVDSQNFGSEYIESSDTSAEAKAYNDKAKTIRAEINTYNSQIKEIRDYNNSVSHKVKTISEKYKADKNSFSSDKLKQIKELRKSIKSNNKKEKTVTEKDSVKSLVQNKEYDKALARLNEILASKKEQLKVLQERNAIWRQIDAIIG